MSVVCHFNEVRLWHVKRTVWGKNAERSNGFIVQETVSASTLPMQTPYLIQLQQATQYIKNRIIITQQYIDNSNKLEKELKLKTVYTDKKTAWCIAKLAND